MKQTYLSKYITSRPFWVNLLVVLAIILLLVLLFFATLGWITNHNKNEKVPNIVGQNIVAATKMLKDKGFDVEIQDSIFVDSAARLSVLKQSPEAEANVKAGRTIYLTINRSIAPEVDMPSLSGFSFKSAQYMLQTLSLKVGDTSYKDCEGQNTILEVLYNGKTIKEGTKLPMGSTINLVLCRGQGSTEIDVPDLVGFTVETALQRLQGLNLSKGSITVRGGSVSDTAKAYVVDQTPVAGTIPGTSNHYKIKAGQAIDLYINSAPPTPKTADSTKQSTNPQTP
jgi:beta-lactam-binding protein with PASTA domain